MSMIVPLYQALASKIAWQPPEGKFEDQRAAEIKRLLDMLPSGAGWDRGTKLDDHSTGERIILYGSFHHMSEHGFYDGWTDHKIIVTPSLRWGREIKITGRDRNDIKDYLHETFAHALDQEVDEWAAVATVVKEG